MRKKLPWKLFLVWLLILGSINFVNFPRSVAPDSRNMALQQNSMPQVNVYYDDYSFVFETETSRREGNVTYTRTYFMRIRPFVIYNGTFYDMKQIVQWIKNNYPNVDYRWLVDRATNAIHYGFNLTKLPQAVADKVDFLGFRLVDLNFPLSAFELEQAERVGADGLYYNITLIKIPKINLAFSFEDLYQYNYSIQHINASYILVGNVRGRENLYCDPIVLSGDTIQVTGYTEEDSANFTKLWEADMNGSYQLLAPKTIPPSGYELSLDVPIRPDDAMLKLSLIVTNLTRAGTIILNGEDSLGDAQTEFITITGDGTYITEKAWNSIDTNGIEFRSGFVFFKNDYDVTPVTSGSWVTVDVSSYIPVGSTGVILDIHNTNTSYAQPVDVRKNGSSDDDYATSDLVDEQHRFVVIGVDDNRVFEAKIGHTSVKLYLSGYCDEKVVMFTDKIDHSSTGSGSWANVDVSNNVSSIATGVILKVINTHDTASLYGNVRKRGSTDDRWYRVADIWRESHIYLLCGVDDAKFFQQKVESTYIDTYLVGYTEPPVTFLTNTPDITPEGWGGWVDVDITAESEASAHTAILELSNQRSSAYQLEVREEGSTDDRRATSYIRHYSHIGALVGVDGDNVFEHYRGSSYLEMIWLMGYTTGAGNYVLEITQPRWGVVTRFADYAFRCDAEIHLLWHINGTWFADEGKQVIFGSTVVYPFVLWDNTHLRLGRMVDSDLKLADRGCHIITTRAYTQINAYDNSYVEFYATTITARDDAWMRLNIDSIDFKMWMSNMDKAEMKLNPSGSYFHDIYRLTLGTRTYGITPIVTVARSSLDDIYIHSTTYAFYAQGDTTLKVTNVVLRNNTYLIRGGVFKGDFYFINCDADNWAFNSLDTGTAHRQYTFDLTITYENHTLMENANVTISNSYLNTSDSWLTYANGSIPQQVYSYGHYNDTQPQIYDYNPYNITIRREGFTTYSALFNITEETHLTIALQEIPADVFPVSWVMAGSVAGLILGCLIAIAWISHVRKEKEREDFILTPVRP